MGAGEWRRGDNRLGVGRRRWKGYRKQGGNNERCSVEDVAARLVYQTHFLLVSGVVVSEQHQTPDLKGRGWGGDNNTEIVWESLRRDLSALTVKKKKMSESVITVEELPDSQTHLHFQTITPLF